MGHHDIQKNEFYQFLLKNGDDAIKYVDGCPGFVLLFIQTNKNTIAYTETLP